MSSIAIGFAVFIPLVCLAFVVAGRFELRVLLGAVYGAAVMLLYYLLFARALVRAADDSDTESVKKRIQASYSLRMLLLVILIGVGLFLSTDYTPAKLFHWVPVIVSMIIPRISIAVWQIIHKKDSNNDNGGGGSDGN